MTRFFFYRDQKSASLYGGAGLPKEKPKTWPWPIEEGAHDPRPFGKPVVGRGKNRCKISGGSNEGALPLRVPLRGKKIAKTPFPPRGKFLSGIKEKSLRIQCHNKKQRKEAWSAGEKAA